jgi:hypothetical protein
MMPASLGGKAEIASDTASEFAVGSVNAHQRPLDMDLVADSPTSAYAFDGELANKILEQPAESFAGL